MRRCLMLRCQCGLSLQGLLLSRNMLLLRGARRCCRLVANGLLLGGARSYCNMLLLGRA